MSFAASTTDKTEQLVALLADIGFTGFEETESGLMAFADQITFDNALLDSVAGQLQVEYRIAVIDEQNWNANWEASFEPILVCDSNDGEPWVAVRAGFHKPVPGVTHEIIITPKMSFGTGHHATTYMMIQQMKGLDFSGKTVADYGTGTAVLAILAEKMGAASVDAIDYDQWSIDNASENLETNNCRAIQLINDTTVVAENTYDIILANINLMVILENLENLRKACKQGGVLLLSGFLKDDEMQLEQALGQYGFRVLNRLQNQEWICLKVRYI